MTKPELEMYSAVPATEFNTFWIPCTWFVNLLRDAKQECRITDSSGLKLIMEVSSEIGRKSSCKAERRTPILVNLLFLLVTILKIQISLFHQPSHPCLS